MAKEEEKDSKKEEEEKKPTWKVGDIEIEGEEYNFKAASAESLSLFTPSEGKLTHSVLGSPPMFNTNADPNNRVYNKFIGSEARIVTIVPGNPKFFKAVGEKGTVHRDEDLLEQLGFPSGVTVDDEGNEVTDKEVDQEAAIVSFLAEGVKSSPDFRYYSFQEAFSTYSEYLNTLVTAVETSMTAKINTNASDNKIANLDKSYQFSTNYDSGWFQTGVSYYMDGQVSVNEVASNDFGPSKVESLAKTASGAMRELRFFLGDNEAELDYQTLDARAEENDSMKEEIGGFVGSGLKFISDLISKPTGTDSVSTVVTGSHLLFPHIWNDSVFDRTYNLTFNFFSPYGDPASIMKYVYLPFLSLLAFTLPREDKHMGYKSPFICGVSCPGYFVSDMAVITSLTWNRGGPNKLFTKDGYPREIEVSISIRDLYPVLKMSKDFGHIKSSNMGMAYFLDSLAGMGIQDQSLINDLNRRFTTMVSRVKFIPTQIKGNISDTFANIKRKMRGNLQK